MWLSTWDNKKCLRELIQSPNVIADLAGNVSRCKQPLTAQQQTCDSCHRNGTRPPPDGRYLKRMLPF